MSRFRITAGEIGSPKGFSTFPKGVASLSLRTAASSDWRLAAFRRDAAMGLQPGCSEAVEHGLQPGSGGGFDHFWLVVWNMTSIFPYIGTVIIKID